MPTRCAVLPGLVLQEINTNQNEIRKFDYTVEFHHLTIMWATSYLLIFSFLDK